MRKCLSIILILSMNVGDVRAAFSFKRTVTVDHNKVTSPGQSNFPVLFAGTYNGSGGILDLRTTGNGGKVQNANGYDIGFYTNSDCATGKMDWELEYYNATTGEVEFWTRVGSLSSASDTVFYVCYGDAGISTDQSNKTGVWDSDYKGVYHLPDGSSLNTNDSTSNASNGTNTNSVTATTAKIDGGGNFVNTSNQYIDLSGHSALAVNGDMTEEAWIYPTYTGGGFASYAVVIGAGNFDIIYSMRWQATTGSIFWIDNSGTHVASVASAVNTWGHIVITRSGTTASFYVNGSAAGTATVNTGGTVSTFVANIGRDPANVNAWWEGKLDEIRISNGARSADWFSTEYANQNDVASFYSLSAESGGGSTPPMFPIRNFLRTIPIWRGIH